MYGKFVKAIHEVQQKSNFKNLLLEKKLAALADTLEKKVTLHLANYSAVHIDIIRVLPFVGQSIYSVVCTHCIVHCMYGPDLRSGIFLSKYRGGGDDGRLVRPQRVWFLGVLVPGFGHIKGIDFGHI